ncbi:Ger(x)C family spore germination protein [Alicyclobacillus fodiniaquatilis]|uniref:Ger(X)C family spore germination protein n=1 Tax=Alicyclobacillus fodiniaquatilis TaxID=1661150 RepID=A0ABW4JLM3_9BACL
MICSGCLFFTTGCWDATELNDRAIVLGWGIDKDAHKGYIQTAQIAIPGLLSSSDGTGENKGKGYLVESSRGDNILDGLNRMQVKLSREVFASHRKGLFVGEGLARDGLKNILDELTRSPTVRLRSDMFIVRNGQAMDVLKIQDPLERIPALAALKMRRNIWGGGEKSLRDFLIAANSKGMSPILPTVSIQQDDLSSEPQVQMEGAAIFDERLKLVGFLNVEDSSLVRWITDKLRRRTIVAEVPGTKGRVSVDLRHMKGRIEPMIDGSDIRVAVTLSGQGTIRESSTQLDFEKSANVSKVEKAVDQCAKAHAIAVIDKVQKQYKTDVFQFGEAIHQKYPYQWRKLQNHWPDKFAELDVSVKVSLTVRNAGLTGASLV